MYNLNYLPPAAFIKAGICALALELTHLNPKKQPDEEVRLATQERIEMSVNTNVYRFIDSRAF